MSTESVKFVAEAGKLVDDLLGSGKDKPRLFNELMQYLLAKTVLAPGETVQYHYGESEHFIISGRRRKIEEMTRDLFMPLQLTNKHYLYVFFDSFVDKKDGFLKVVSTKLAYQRDRNGDEQFFRFDHNRQPDNHYPMSHVHVYGNWKHPGIEKDMGKIHFPVLRPTMEGLIRLLVYECDVKPVSAPDVWEPMLKRTETAFIQVARTRALEAEKKSHG